MNHPVRFHLCHAGQEPLLQILALMFSLSSTSLRSTKTPMLGAVVASVLADFDFLLSLLWSTSHWHQPSLLLPFWWFITVTMDNGYHFTYIWLTMVYDQHYIAAIFTLLLYESSFHIWNALSLLALWSFLKNISTNHSDNSDSDNISTNHSDSISSYINHDHMICHGLLSNVIKSISILCHYCEVYYHYCRSSLRDLPVIQAATNRTVGEPSSFHTRSSSRWPQGGQWRHWT